MSVDKKPKGVMESEVRMTDAAAQNEASMAPMEETMRSLSLFTMRVVALLADAENELNDTVSQEIGIDETNLWEAIANQPRRLRPRLSRKAA
jgi:hypothetical protein